MTRLVQLSSLIVLSGTIAWGQEIPVAKAPRTPAATATAPTAAESGENHEVARKLETALARPAQELAQDGLKLGAEILAELDHGNDLARLEQRETHLEQRLQALRKSLAEKQAGSKQLKQELTSRSTEIAEQYDDEDVRDRLLHRLIDDIKPQLLDLKSDMETLESEAKAVMTRLAELRVLTAERRFARDQSARSTRSTERRRNVSVTELEKKWSPLPKLNTPRERMVPGRSAATKPNTPTAPATSPLDQLKELDDL